MEVEEEGTTGGLRDKKSLRAQACEKKSMMSSESRLHLIVIFNPLLSVKGTDLCDS